MPNLVPFPPKGKAAFKAFMERVPFAPEMHKAVQPELMEPLIEPNARGGITIPAEGWTCVYSVVVQPEMCNALGNMHGGAAATLVDTISSTALSMITTPTFWGPPMLSGVSVALDVKYLNPAPLGAKCRITVFVEHMGGMLSNLRIDITDWDTGRRFVSGVHVKAWKAGPKKEAKL